MTRRMREVTKSNPCPICGGADWCAFFDEGRAVICERSSDGCARRKDGSMIQTVSGGYVHRLEETRPDTRPRQRMPKRDDAPRYAEMRAEAVRCYRATQTDELDADLVSLARSLGVELHTLINLGIGWCDERKAWTFPMKDAQHRVVGIRTRGLDGAKRSFLGSKQGLFFPPLELWSGLKAPWLIVEGPTDAAAALSYGYMAVGRPSNASAVEMTAELVRGQEVVIVADDEEAKVRPKDGVVFRPGLDGAHTLADALVGVALSVKVVAPAGFKDLRGARQSGMDGEMLAVLLSAASEWQKREVAA